MNGSDLVEAGRISRRDLVGFEVISRLLHSQEGLDIEAVAVDRMLDQVRIEQSERRLSVYLPAENPDQGVGQAPKRASGSLAWAHGLVVENLKRSHAHQSFPLAEAGRGAIDAGRWSVLEEEPQVLQLATHSPIACNIPNHGLVRVSGTGLV